MLWNRTYGGQFRSLIETSDGGYAMAGEIWGVKDAILIDFWLVKTDANGNEEWHRTYGGANLDYACCLVETSDGGYALAGGTSEIGAGDDGCWLVKTDSNGYIQWNQTYSGISEDMAYSLVVTSDGGYVLAGYTTSSENNDVWLVKTDANGNVEWNQTYGGPYNEKAYCLVETSDGGYAIAGKTKAFDRDGDFWLVKTDEHGIIPEFPSWTILPLLLFATVVVIIYKHKLPKTPNKQQSY